MYTNRKQGNYKKQKYSKNNLETNTYYVTALIEIM